jgi:hypothetical protein
MAYSVYSSLDANLLQGPLSIRAGVSAANIDRAVASIDEEITRLVTDGLTQKELDDSRRFLIHAMPRALETNAGIANYLQTAEFFILGLDFDGAFRICLAPSRSTRPMRRRGVLAVDRHGVIAGPVANREPPSWRHSPRLISFQNLSLLAQSCR